MACYAPYPFHGCHLSLGKLDVLIAALYCSPLSSRGPAVASSPPCSPCSPSVAGVPRGFAALPSQAQGPVKGFLSIAREPGSPLDLQALRLMSHSSSASWGPAGQPQPRGTVAEAAQTAERWQRQTRSNSRAGGISGGKAAPPSPPGAVTPLSIDAASTSSSAADMEELVKSLLQPLPLGRVTNSTLADISVQVREGRVGSGSGWGLRPEGQWRTVN